MGVEREGDGGHGESAGGGAQPAHDRRVPHVDAVEVSHGHRAGGRLRMPTIAGGGDDGWGDRRHGRRAGRKTDGEEPGAIAAEV
jgi:hypothetical protein